MVRGVRSVMGVSMVWVVVSLMLLRVLMRLLQSLRLDGREHGHGSGVTGDTGRRRHGVLHRRDLQGARQRDRDAEVREGVRVSAAPAHRLTPSHELLQTEGLSQRIHFPPCAVSGDAD